MLTALYLYLALGVVAGLLMALYPLVLDIKTYFHNRKFPLAQRSYNWGEHWWPHMWIVILVTLPIVNIGTLIIFCSMVWKPMNFIIKFLKTH